MSLEEPNTTDESQRIEALENTLEEYVGELRGSLEFDGQKEKSFRGTSDYGIYYFDLETDFKFKLVGKNGRPSHEVKALAGEENLSLPKYMNVLDNWEEYDAVEITDNKDEKGYTFDDEELGEHVKEVAEAVLEEYGEDPFDIPSS